MKKIKILRIILISAIAILSGCYKEYIEPGVITTEKRSVENFTGINVSNAMQVYIAQGDTELVEIEAYSGYLPHIITEKIGGVLHIYFDRTLERQHRVYKHQQKVYITLKSLSKIEASGATEVNSVDNISADNIAISLSGASELNLSLSASTIDYCNLSGSSYVTLTGNAISVNRADLSGASRLKAFNFTVESMYIDLTGASHAEVNVTHELDATASGASKVIYKGNPAILRKNVSGASKIIKF